MLIVGSRMFNNNLVGGFTQQSRLFRDSPSSICRGFYFLEYRSVQDDDGLGYSISSL